MSPTRPRQPRPFKYFSIFSGIGGFELGIQRAYIRSRDGDSEATRSTPLIEGLEERQSGVVRSGSKPNGYDRQTPICLGFSEIDKYATQIYKTHFNHKEYGDVSAIDWSDTEDFNLLFGGFPCQAFSIAGKRRGFDDTRGTLFFEIARCLREKQPRLLLLENVKGLLSHAKGQTFGVVLNTLDELGYDLQWQVLNSKNFGVPQNRERVFIVGHLRGTSRPEVFPIGESCQGSIKRTEQTTVVRCLQGGGHSGGHHSSMSILRTNESSTRPEGDKSDNPNSIGRATCSDDMRIRRLTPTECERLQGFPDGWTEGISDTQRYKCLGNAVTVNVIETIMVKLLEVL